MTRAILPRYQRPSPYLVTQGMSNWGCTMDSFASSKKKGMIINIHKKENVKQIYLNKLLIVVQSKHKNRVCLRLHGSRNLMGLLQRPLQLRSLLLLLCQHNWDRPTMVADEGCMKMALPQLEINIWHGTLKENLKNSACNAL